MRCEDISDALELLDDGMIEHTLMIREKRMKKRSEQRPGGKQNRIRKVQYAAAACLCLICVGAAAVRFAFPYEPEPELPERFVAISSLLAADDGNLMEKHAEKCTAVPIEQYKGIYAEVPSVDGSVLSESMGKSVDDAKGWYCISGHSDRQYLIRNDGQEFSLWKFQCFDSGEYPYEDVLKLVYQIHSADGITEIEVMPAQMDRSDGGMKIQDEIGTRIITDRASIETVYGALSGMTCYGRGRWDRIDYGDAEVASDGESESDHEAVKLGRYLSITTAYGNVIDGLKYTAVSDMFYEFSGIAYEPLTQEQAAGVWEVIGIRRSGEEKEEHFDANPGHGETDSDRQEIGELSGTEKVYLSQATNTGVGLEYVTELQDKVSEAMRNHELPFVVVSAVYENPYRLYVVVTSDAEEDLQKLWDLDSAGGVLEVEYAPGYSIHLH